MHPKMRLRQELEGCANSDVFNWDSLREMIRRRNIAVAAKVLCETNNNFLQQIYF